jgi:hypothetical protein
MIPLSRAVFARYPAAMLATVNPVQPLCFNFHQAAIDIYFQMNVPFEEKKNKLMVYGALNKDFYFLRTKALELFEKNNSLIYKRPHPGYGQVNSIKIAKETAEEVSKYKFALAGVLYNLDKETHYLIAKHVEIIAAGTVMVTDEVAEPYLRAIGLFKDKHYIAASLENLEETINYYLHPDREEVVQKMAEEARKIVDKHHSNSIRASELDRTVTYLYLKHHP